MTTQDPGESRMTPSDAAESEERELTERSAVERGAGSAPRGEQDDPREEEGWTQPESSAQKGAIRDEG